MKYIAKEFPQSKLFISKDGMYNVTHCSTCAAAKPVQKLTKSTEMREEVKRPLEVVHGDISGYYAAEAGCARYFLTLLDEASYFVETTSLETTGEATSTFMSWIRRQNSYFKSNGTEFINDNLGIEHNRSHPHEQ